MISFETTPDAFAATTTTLLPELKTNTSKSYLHQYNVPSTGVALEGYCPVSYFVPNQPVRGNPKYASTYKGITYHLADAARKREFERDPEKYLPAYGGWCAFGMTLEEKFPVDPTAFKIVDDRLMLFLRNENIDALHLWNQDDESAETAIADAFWSRMTS